jgi:hypothetical protein
LIVKFLKALLRTEAEHEQFHNPSFSGKPECLPSFHLGEDLMYAKVLCRVLAAVMLGGVWLASCFSQNTECQRADTSPTALKCVSNSSPIVPPALTSGAKYVSVTDPTKTLFATFLYRDSSNQMPSWHRAKGEAIARALQPLNASGGVDLANGKLAAIAEGMSNTRDEMNAFNALLASRKSELNPAFTFANLSEGGCDLMCWIAKGVGTINKQVQIAFIKHSNNRPQKSDGSPENPNSAFPDKASKNFPTHAQTTKAQLKTRVLAMKKQYPNLKMVFFTSRTFGGWTCAPTGSNYREPVAYEEGFAVKWLLDDQITGRDPDLRFEGANAPAAWMAWGPYLWDAQKWTQDLFRSDGAHMCEKGTAIVGQTWFDFFMGDNTARPWFAKGGTTLVEERESANASYAGEFALWQNYPNPFNAQTEIQFSLPEPGVMKLAIYNVQGRLVRTLWHDLAQAGVHKLAWDGLNDFGQSAPSGAYIYKLEAGANVFTRTLTLLK